MTAHELLADIFCRVQGGPGNLRAITKAQFDWLRDLIGSDKEGGALKPGMNGGFSWAPSGRWKYTFAVKIVGDKVRYSVVRSGTLTPTGAGTLFG